MERKLAIRLRKVVKRYGPTLGTDTRAAPSLRIGEHRRHGGGKGFWSTRLDQEPGLAVRHDVGNTALIAGHHR